VRRITSNGNIVSGEILITKAREIWPQIPRYRHLKVPEFSSGWLARFDERYNIPKRTRHGEAASIPSETFEEMKAIRTICGEYPEDGIYNTDETGFSWRHDPQMGSQAKQFQAIRKLIVEYLLSNV
jgi:Tc5 transposase DNA-binding domain